MRECKNFDPKGHLYPVEGTNPVEWSIAAADRVRWFLEYCEEHGVTGVIDDSEIRFERDFVVAVASVYMDGKLVAKATSGLPYDPNDRFVVATVSTYARSRALANCGFGPLAACGNAEGGNREVLPETGVTFEKAMEYGMNPYSIAPVSEQPEEKEPVQMKKPKKAKSKPAPVEEKVEEIVEEQIEVPFVDEEPTAPAAAAPVSEPEPEIIEAASIREEIPEPQAQEEIPVTAVADPAAEFSACANFILPVGNTKGMTIEESYNKDPGSIYFIQKRKSMLIARYPAELFEAVDKFLEYKEGKAS